MEPININDLTPEQRAVLLDQLRKDEEEAQRKRQRQQEAYDDLKETCIVELFDFLTGISDRLKEGKKRVFNAVEPLLELKKELHGLTVEDLAKQQSHTFTNRRATKSIITGYNVIDGWDEDLTAAAKARIDRWLTSKINKDNEMFVSMVRDLLNATGDGKLKASRVMELHNKAKQFGDRELIEALDLLQQGYKPVKTSTYVKAKYKDEKGVWKYVELSMSQA